MALDLIKPVEPVTASGLTQADIDEFHRQLDEFVDGLVAEQKRQMPNQPVEVLRALLMRGQCKCKAAERLLKEPQT
jgi:hypothetical protein